MSATPAAGGTPAAVARPDALAVLCDRCLGRRLVGAIGPGQSDAARAARHEAGWDAVAEADCPVCEGSFADADAWLAAAQAALAPYEYATFQLGTLFPAPCERLEAELAAAANAALGSSFTDSLRTEANRLLAPQLPGTTVAEGRPDVAVVVDTRFWTASARATSVFVAGRYTKHRRDLPQTHWPCKRCQGSGCWECDDRGALYPSSVEDVVAAALVPAFGASGASFHGAGREDIDALMLGAGRPFVLELHDPKRREVDLAAAAALLQAQREQSGVGVDGLAMTDRDEVARLKAAAHDKEYLAHCVADAPVSPERLAAAAAGLIGTVEQRTPERVSHRRADLVRRRSVHRASVEAHDGARFTLRVLAESGTYIKELVSGDAGRTQPSLSGRLEVAARVEFLDVVGVLD